MTMAMAMMGQEDQPMRPMMNDTQDLLTLFESENEKLEAENRLLRFQLVDRDTQLAAAMAEIRKLTEELRRVTPRPVDPPLKGLKIAVVGHPKREGDYKEVIEGVLGGKLCYAPASEKPGLTYKQVAKADGTVYITTFGDHRCLDQADKASAATGMPIEYIAETNPDLVGEFVMKTLLPRILKAKECASRALPQ